MSNAAMAVLSVLSPRRLVGPILDKELRVSSRRRRNYVVRAVYLGLLTLFVTLNWFAADPYSRSAAVRTAAMARMGMEITMVIGWFQFLTCQVLALVMLSSAISEEVYNRTLGVLMTTPINSLQIVVGKLASRLLQVLLLMAMTLPLLAIVRVFGGIAWGYLAGVWVLTFATVLFAGSVSLFFSIFCQRAYAVILWATMSLVALWGGVPLLTVLVGIEFHLISNRQWEWLCARTNPYFGLVRMTDWLFSPRALPTGIHAVWLWPSLWMVLGTLVLLAVAIARVRIVARRQITGGLSSTTKRSGRSGAVAVAASATGARIRGCPVLWKELRTPLLGRRRWVTILGTLAILAILGLVYGVAADERALKDSRFHITMIFIYMLLGGLFSIVFPATTVTTEKETRSWPILLGTTLGDWRIVLAKGLGALRRSLPAWGFLAVHTGVFVVLGTLHPVAALQLAIASAGLMAFVTGTGLYFSSRLRHTTTAVIANLAVPIVLWVLGPIVLGLLSEINHTGGQFVMEYMSLCPFAQAVLIAEPALRHWAGGTYNFGNYHMDMAEANTFLLTTMMVFVFLGLVFAAMAKANLRKRVF
jgi:ABC-type transport system involved in multi-copper enzyme maturation permease subunit